MNDNEVTPIRGMTLQNGKWVINKQVEGRTLFKRTGTADYSEARRIFDSMVRSIRRMAAEEAWKKAVMEWEADPKSWLHRAVRRMHSRRKGHWTGRTVTLSQLATLLLQSNGRCQVTGIAFSDRRVNGSRVVPFMPSIDRIDSSRGYEWGNCRVVCLAVNLAMRDWGTEAMIRIAKALLLRHLQDEIDGVTEDTPPNVLQMSAPTAVSEAESALSA